MARGRRLVEGWWRIVETEIWDQRALDLVVPAHITFDRNGLGEMQLIAIGASIDYRVEARGGAPIVEFSPGGNSGDTILNYFGRLEKLLGRILHRQKPGRKRG